VRQILHVDMDAFYASVEQRDQPHLRGKPVVVGGASRRGVVAAASYEARVFGVRSAMSMVEAMKRCPQAEVVAPRGARYEEVSREIFAVMRRFTPLVEGLSLDEAFLDVTGSRSLFGSGEVVARQIKEDILAQTGLTASAGVARHKFAAKIASDLDKPDGLVVVPEDVAAFLSNLELERMWGVGPKASRRLREAGFATMGDLALADRARLMELMGPSWGAHVHDLARGIDDREVVPGGAAVSMGAEETVEQDLLNRAQIARRLLGQSARVAGRLVAEGIAGRVVTIKLKQADFKVLTRRVTLPRAIADTDSIYGAALTLLDRMDIEGQRYRLTGVSVSKLEPLVPAQPELFVSESKSRRNELERVTQQVKERFGAAAGLRRATLLEKDPDHDDDGI